MTYEYGCEAVQVQLANIPECYGDLPIMDKKGEEVCIRRKSDAHRSLGKGSVCSPLHKDGTMVGGDKSSTL